MDLIPCPLDSKSDAIAIYTQDRAISYSELNQLVRRLAALDLPEKPIAFIAKRSVETIAFFFALWRMGRLALPLSPRLPPVAVQAAIQATGAYFIEPTFSNKENPDARIDLSRPATLLFTSGTTAAPKIALHTLKSHFQSALGAIPLLNLQSGDRYSLDLPLNHVGGLAILLRTFLSGAALILPPAAISPTHLSLVPTQLLRLIKNGNVPTNAKCILIGGAALAIPTPHLPIYRSYGMTETSSMIALQEPYQLLPKAELCIKNGEIHVRGPMLFQGYYCPGKIPHLPLKEGWFATGDLGEIKNGALHWYGRKDRQFTSGGENIQPEEIEKVLLELPDILEAHVKPEPDEEFGQQITAALFSDQKLDTAQIEAKLRERLPGYKIPKQWKILSAPLKGT